MKKLTRSDSVEKLGIMENDGPRPTYTLFWEALSGAMVVELVLEEIGASYERRLIDMANGEHLTDNYRTLNPTGQVPALLLPNGDVIGESAAIVLTLGERHPSASLIPSATSAIRPHFLRWLIYLATSPYMTMVQFNHPERFTSISAVHGDLVENAKSRLVSQFEILDGAISGSPYFFQTGFSAVDLYLFMLVNFFPAKSEIFQNCNKLRGLYEAVEGRPSTTRIISNHVVT